MEVFIGVMNNFSIKYDAQVPLTLKMNVVVQS